VGDDADVRGPADRGRGRAGMGERARAEGNAAPTCGPERSVRERRKGAGAEGNWAGTRPTREEKEKGKRESPRVRERRGKRGIGLGQGFGVGLRAAFFHSFFFSILYPFKQNHLNSNTI
jgi:hypothetical protein